MATAAARTTSSTPSGAKSAVPASGAYYEEKDLLEMEFSEEEDRFTSPCPCGDKFFISIDALFENEERAECPSCSLVLHVHYDPDAVHRRFGGGDDDGDHSSVEGEPRILPIPDAKDKKVGKP